MLNFLLNFLFFLLPTLHSMPLSYLNILYLFAPNYGLPDWKRSVLYCYIGVYAANNNLK